MYEICKNSLMNAKQNLILSLDDLVLDLPKIKDALWIDICQKNDVATSQIFNELSFDANSEKIEKLSREYPRYAPFFEEVNTKYHSLVADHLKNFKIEEKILKLFEKFHHDFNVSFLTNLSISELEDSGILKQFNFEPTALFSTKEVLSAKPDAAIYLKIARKFNDKVQRLITVDATVNGVQAGYLANTKAIYVATNYPISQWAKDYSIAFLNGLDDLEHTLYHWLKDQSV